MSTISTYVILKKCLLSQAGFGISANIFLLLFRISVLIVDHCPKPADLVTSHLAFSHIVMLLTVVFLVSPDLFESLNFQNDFKCKSFFYTSRVMRSLSICTSCYLSVLQAITISPSTSWLARFKEKFSRFSFHSFLFFWGFSLSVSSNMLIYTVASSNVTQPNILVLSKYCSFSSMSYIIKGLFSTLTMSRDLSFVVIMMLSSAYMIMFLSRHQRKVQYLHRTNFPPRASAEQRATRAILLMMSFFVAVYWVDSIISFSSTQLWAYEPLVLSVQRLVENGYATVSPLVLISSDKRIANILQNMW